MDLSKLSEEELFRVRIRDLPLAIEGSWLENCVNELHKEFDLKGIKFKPPCYLADEWLAPDGEPIIGIPFFLAHPALMKLEKKMMLDVEGGTRPWCMKLLRHEAGHALNYAYKLYRRKKWQKAFGRFSQEYKDTYRWRPYSRSFVRHLDDYYAQYHPDEDFAETFAVWLTPGLNWQKQYNSWKALNKLNYVDKLMNEIKSKEPLVKKGKKYWQASRMSTTLGNFYKKKKRFHAEEFPDFHDSNLKRIFVPRQEGHSKGKAPSAAEIIKKYKRDILNGTAKWTGEKKYIINDLLSVLIRRSKKLKLEACEAEPLYVLELSAYVTALVMNYLYTGKFRRKSIGPGSLR